MATIAPQQEAKTPLRVPPPEKFWKRYSPHGEAPLSLAGSVAAHLLAGGGLLLMGMLLAWTTFKPDRTLPVTPVRLLAGGGGKPSGVGDGKGVGSGGVTDTGGKDEETIPGDKPTERPSLNPIEQKRIEEKYDPSTARFINKTQSGAQFARLDEALRARITPSDGTPGKGRGGPGSGGGKDGGKGVGEGGGTGAGKSKLNAREKRMLRWHMRFTANSGRQYVDQLRALGAILAIPVSDRADTEYKIVRDLRPGKGKLLDEDVSRLQRIYWIDDKPGSVRDVLDALGLRIEPLPARFIAFMPERLEKTLHQMEREYVTGVLRLPFDEDKIDETSFKVVRGAGGYVPKLLAVSMRR